MTEESLDLSEVKKSTLSIPQPPQEFASVEAERAYRKEKLAGVLRVVGFYGLAEGVAGHITARDPEHTDHFWVNPFGKSFKHMTVADLILVNPAGEVVVGDKPVNTAAYAIHHAIHTAHPEVVCAVHTHTVYGKAFAATDLPLKMLSQDACMFYNDWVRHRDGGGAIVLEAESAKKMADAFSDAKAMIHQNHGLLTTGQYIEEAAWWFLALERACQVQMIAEATGPVVEVPDEYAQFTFDATGYPLAGWFQFQPLWEDMVARDGMGWAQ